MADAEMAGFDRLVQVCRRILPDEQRMAEFLFRALPDEIENYLLQVESK